MREYAFIKDLQIVCLIWSNKSFDQLESELCTPTAGVVRPLDQFSDKERKVWLDEYMGRL